MKRFWFPGLVQTAAAYGQSLTYSGDSHVTLNMFLLVHLRILYNRLWPFILLSNSTRSSPTFLPTQFHVISQEKGGGKEGRRKKHMEFSLCAPTLPGHRDCTGVGLIYQCLSTKKTDFPLPSIYQMARAPGQRVRLPAHFLFLSWHFVCLGFVKAFCMLSQCEFIRVPALQCLEHTASLKSSTTSSPYCLPTLFPIDLSLEGRHIM